MINHQLRDFIEENIPNFDSSNAQDVIKAEKILKAEARLNGSFSIHEIEGFMEYLRNPNFDFEKIYNLPVIKEISEGKIPKILNFDRQIHSLPTNEIEEFSLIFAPKIKEYFAKCIREQNWTSMIRFHSNYAAFISSDSLEFLKMNIHDKNKILIEGIYSSFDYVKFQKDYPFSTDPLYYSLQSEVDNFFFDEDVLDINNAVAANQNTSIQNKVILGRILIALNGFKSQNSTTKNVITENREVARSWAGADKGFLASIIYRIVGFFNPLTKNRNLVFGISVFFWTLLLSITVFLLSKNLVLGFAFILSNLLLAFIGAKIPKSYYGKQENLDFKQKLITYTGCALIVILTRILWFILVPSVLANGLIQMFHGQFPLSLVIIIGFLMYHLYQNYYKR